MIAPALLEILRCPATGQRLRPATPEELKRLDGEEALASADGRKLYPVRDGIPLLVALAAVDAKDSPLSIRA